MGVLTSALADWLAERSGTVYCIEPYPSAEFRGVVQEHTAAKLIAGASPGALDGHRPATSTSSTATTTSGPCRRSSTTSTPFPGAGGHLPLILLHDVGWPWGQPRHLLLPRDSRTMR